MKPSSYLRRAAAALPASLRQALKRRHYARQIRTGTFTSDEPEFARLGEWVRPGDWALDIGANIGHYTLALSRLVGHEGRVLAFEPVPETFELLVANMAASGCRNASLLNAAASDEAAVSGMVIPRNAIGTPNLYQSRLLPGPGEMSVLCLSVDRLDLPGPVRLVKVDAEGHEESVIRGMEGLLTRASPRLIVEDTARVVGQLLESLGYRSEKLAGSPNRLWEKA